MQCQILASPHPPTASPQSQHCTIVYSSGAFWWILDQEPVDLTHNNKKPIMFLLLNYDDDDDDGNHYDNNGDITNNDNYLRGYTLVY